MADIISTFSHPGEKQKKMQLSETLILPFCSNVCGVIAHMNCCFELICFVLTMLYSSSRRRCDGPAEQYWGWSTMSGRQLLHVSWRQPVWATWRGGDGIPPPCCHSGPEGVCVCVRSAADSLPAELFTSVSVVLFFPSLLFACSPSQLSSLPWPSLQCLFTLLLRSLTMEASAILLPTSPCSQRTWTPCPSVGPFMLMEPWWWVSAEPLWWRGRRPWLAQPTVVKLTFNLRPDYLVGIWMHHPLKVLFHV